MYKLWILDMQLAKTSQKRICNNNISLHGFVHSDYPINFDSSQSFIQYLLAIICEQCVLITTLWLILLFFFLAKLWLWFFSRKLGLKKEILWRNEIHILTYIRFSRADFHLSLSLSKHQFHKRQSFPREKTIKQEMKMVRWRLCTS